MIPLRSLLRSAVCAAACLLLIPARSDAAPPSLLNHQGRIAVNGVNFEGTGQFKFALVNGTGSISYWSNNGTSTAGSQPTAAVSLPVVKGLYAVLLGDASLANMTAVPVAVFDNADVRLRVWFNDGANGFQLITPDQRLAAAPYSLVAAKAEQVLLSNVYDAPAKPVLAWGDNASGQIVLPAMTGVAAAAAGGDFSVILLNNGTVATAGSIATAPAEAVNVTEISAGPGHCLARKADSTVVAWGNNTYGQINVPAGIANATSVAAGEKHSLVLRSNGTLTAWGDNSFGQTTIPAAAVNVTAIACGYDHCLALKSDGTVVAWGRNDTGQTIVPSGLSGVVSIAAGAFHSLAVKSDGTLISWGWNIAEQSTVPAGLTGVKKAAGGYAFSIALKNDGTVVAWGNNTKGQTNVPGDAGAVTAISAGSSHSLAVRTSMLPVQVARLDGDNLFTGKTGMKRAAAANVLEVEGQASKTTAGNWLANSDGRIKTEVQPVTGALEKLDQVRLVDFRYTDAYRAAHPDVGDRRYLNVIAQEFAKVFPDDVKDSGEKLPDGSPILQVDTYPLTIYSAAAVQELHRENQYLKRKLAEQEERLRKLEAVLNNK